MEFGTREHAIRAYEGIVERWNDPDNDLKELLPNKYEEICITLELLKSGKDFNIIDKTKDLAAAIGYVAGQIPSINVKRDQDGEVFISIDNRVTYEEAESYAKELNKDLGDEYKMWSD